VPANYSSLPDAKTLATQIAAEMQLEVFDISAIAIDDIIPDLLDDTFIRQYRVLPLAIEQHILRLAISEPAQMESISEIKFHTDLAVHPVIVEADKLSRLVDGYLSQRQYQSMAQFQLTEGDDTRIIQFVEQILQDALQRGASDIHLEPYKTAYRIRFRIDGILHKMAQFPLAVANRMVARLKVVAKLDISERRLPQDGRFSIAINTELSKDCRLSTCPTLFGEKIVLRILDANKVAFNIDDLGLADQQKSILMQAIYRPQGMVLVTGPTGSGKTISLYTILSLLNKLDKNICSVEEPVEITLPGINQVNVNLKAELTFAKVLRAFLRQDPDILMVGEIRDQETAETALKAAQTGHLVFSTLHTNSAIETLTRLMMMGISVVDVAHAVHLIIAQRLVRRLCHFCKQPRVYTKDILLHVGFLPKDLSHLTVYEPVGCEHCMKGYSGRIGLFELLLITPEIVELIIAGTSIAIITRAAQQQGMWFLRDSALHAVMAGVTSLEEIQRVVIGL
jgi:type IV pilus assembly protein PilB